MLFCLGCQRFVTAAAAPRASLRTVAQQRQRDEREDDHREQAGGDERDVVRRPDQPEVDADLAGDDGDAERRRLQQPAGDELAPALGEAAGRAAPAAPRTTSSAARKIGTRASVEPLVEEARDVELDPGRDEEERDEDAEADRLELVVEERVRHALVAVDELQRRAGEERAEDRLEPELRGEHDEHREQQERAAHADLGGRVLQPQRASARRASSARARGSTTPTATTKTKNAISSASFAPMPPDSPEKNSESRTIGPTSAIEAPATTTWPNGVDVSPASLRIGRMIAEAGRREDDRDEQRRAHEVAGAQAEADDERDPERDDVAEDASAAAAGRAAGRSRSRARRAAAGTRARSCSAPAPARRPSPSRAPAGRRRSRAGSRARSPAAAAR